MNDWKKECIRIKARNYKPIKPKEFFAKYGHLLRTASVYETMGPNWKDIIWRRNSPTVFKKEVNSNAI